MKFTNMTNNVAIYVPSTVNATKRASDIFVGKMVDATARALSTLFGGATACEGLGYYVSDNGQLIREKVTIVSAFCPEIADNICATIEAIASEIAAKMGQECVLYTINSEAFLTDSTPVACNFVYILPDA